MKYKNHLLTIYRWGDMGTGWEWCKFRATEIKWNLSRQLKSGVIFSRLS